MMRSLIKNNTKKMCMHTVHTAHTNKRNTPNINADSRDEEYRTPEDSFDRLL